MNGSTFSLVAIAIPFVGFVVLLIVWSLRSLWGGALWLVPKFIRRRTAALEDRALSLLPPPGRTTRTLTWFFLFGTLLVLLAQPFVPDAWAADAREGFPALSAGRWMIALCIGVTTLCAAVCAWEPETPIPAWGFLLLLESLCLLIAASHTPAITFLALDLAALTTALVLCFWSTPDLVDLPGARVRALRRYLTLTLLASALAWAALPIRSSPLADYLILASLVLRCGLIPFHTPLLDLHDRSSAPIAMMLTGALLPATLLTTALSGLLSPHLTPVFAIAVGWAWCASVRQTDLRRAIGWWTLAGASTALGFLTLTPSQHLMPFLLMLIGVSTGATMATFLAGVIERDVGHREISRLSGLAARTPGGYGWMVIAALISAGTPPFASFAARLLISPTSATFSGIFLTTLASVLATGAAFQVINRTFLGLPRTSDETPIDLTSRQKLVLLLLLVCCLIGPVIPATLLRNTPASVLP